MLHLIGDVIRLGRCHALAVFIAGGFELGVIDGLALQPHVDDAVDMLARRGRAAGMAGKVPGQKARIGLNRAPAGV